MDGGVVAGIFMVLFGPDSSQPPRTQRARRPRSLPAIALLLASLLAVPRPAAAASLDDARKLFNSGKYLECIEACGDAIQDSRLNGDWWVLKVRAEMATGQYKEALATYRGQASGVAYAEALRSTVARTQDIL